MNTLKPIHGTPQPVNVPPDMTTEPPVPCRFKVGEIVEHTNGNGLQSPQIVRGFAHKVSEYGGRFVYLDWDCWWLDESPEKLRSLSEVPKDSDIFRYKWGKTLANGQRVLVDAVNLTVTPQA